MLVRLSAFCARTRELCRLRLVGKCFSFEKCESYSTSLPVNCMVAFSLQPIELLHRMNPPQVNDDGGMLDKLKEDM
jgi:hypothetical protein